MRRRLATPAGLVAAVAVFTGIVLGTGSLVWATVLGLIVGLGVNLMLDDRTPVEVRGDDYTADADRKVEQALGVVREIRKLSRDVTSSTARAALQSACDEVPELFDRTRATSPDSLYSTASQLGAHLVSLRGVVTQYLDIQRKPAFYADPDGLRRGGDEAFRRFVQFVRDNVRFVNQGDIARYRANLETVAPPALPDLGRETS